MGLFDDAIEFLARVENPKERQMNTRQRFSASQTKELMRDNPGVPGEFVAYLNEVGSGAFRECQFTVYGFLQTPDEVLGKNVQFREDTSITILCFGDNFSGDISGFLPSERWAVAELWHEDGTLFRINKPFGKYIRERMLMGPGGKDLRVR